MISMTPSRTLSQVPAWQRERALVLHREFLALERDLAAGDGASDLVKALAGALAGREIVVRDHDGREIDRRPFRASVQNLWTLLRKWRGGGRRVEAMLPAYQSAGHHRPLPDALKSEIQRRASAQRGGRDKHARGNDASVYDQLCRDWAAGKPIRGLGTWRDWWQADPRTARLPVPALAPEFPWCERTLRRHSGCRALKDAGNIGAAAAAKHLPHLTLDYSRLRKCELYTLDDVRLDVACLDDATGQPVEAYAYILMEVASRSIVAFMLKPSRHVKAEDVDELLARGLQTPGYGIGVGYVTHIRFERGTVACSEAAQAILEGGSGDRVKIHRTSMDGGVRWAGAAPDRATGHASGKAVIESFMRQLHGRLNHLPGQRGNKRENSPANLGFEDRHELRPRSKRDSLTQQAQTLGEIRAAAIRSGERPKIALPMLLFSQLRAAVETAVRDHNADPGHAYQGHSTRAEMEIAPGVWAEIEDPAA